MKENELTSENIITILLDAKSRKTLIQAIKAEQGTFLPLSNEYSQLAPQCQASEEELRQVSNILLEEDDDYLLENLIFHPNMPDDVLFHLVDSDKYITRLAHRSGPQELLEKLASEYQYSEAVTTLALDYYSQPDFSTSEFREFIQKYRDDFMLEHNVRRLKNVSEEKKQVVIDIFGEREKKNK